MCCLAHGDVDLASIAIAPKTEETTVSLSALFTLSNDKKTLFINGDHIELPTWITNPERIETVIIGDHHDALDQFIAWQKKYKQQNKCAFHRLFFSANHPQRTQISKIAYDQKWSSTPVDKLTAVNRSIYLSPSDHGLEVGSLTRRGWAIVSKCWQGNAAVWQNIYSRPILLFAGGWHQQNVQSPSIAKSLWLTSACPADALLTIPQTRYQKLDQPKLFDHTLKPVPLVELKGQGR